jgi:hypothetical protein
MLIHINQFDIAERVHNAWLRTTEDGIHTYDIFKEGISKQKVDTKEFTDTVVARLGQKPQTLNSNHWSAKIKSASGDGLNLELIANCADRVAALGLEIAMTVSLRNFDGNPGDTLAQGQ